MPKSIISTALSEPWLSVIALACLDRSFFSHLSQRSPPPSSASPLPLLLHQFWSLRLLLRLWLLLLRLQLWRLGRAFKTRRRRRHRRPCPVRCQCRASLRTSDRLDHTQPKYSSSLPPTRATVCYT